MCVSTSKLVIFGTKLNKYGIMNNFQPPQVMGCVFCETQLQVSEKLVRKGLILLGTEGLFIFYF